jgi:hypothetical protein
MRSRSGWAVLSLLLLVSGCRNLFVPDPPEKGALDGQVVDGDGQPLVANLELVPEEGEVLTKQSDSTGVFEFTGLVPGRYAFRAYADGYLEQQRTLTIVAQVTRSVGTVRLYSLAQPGADDGTITGQVKIESDADPNGAEVEFSNPVSGQVVAKLAVGASGTFLQRLPPGDWQLVAKHPLYVASTPTMVTLAAKQSVQIADPIQLAINPGRVHGSVRLEVDRSSNTIPATGAIVSSDTSVSVPVDAMGNFELGSLAGGLRRVRVTLPGFHDTIDAHLIDVEPGMTSTLPEIVLRLDRGNITGEVEMGDNTPLVDVTASLAFTTPDAGTNPYAAQVSGSGSRGTYLLRDVPVGQYAVKAVRNNYIAATSPPVAVTKGGTATADALRLFRVQGDFELDDGDASNTPGFTRTPNLTLRLSNAGSPAEYRVSESVSGLAAAAWQPFTTVITPSNIPFTLASGDGTHTLYIQYRDAQMNQSGTLSSSAVLDTAPPTPDSLVLEQGAAFTRQNVRLSLTVSATDPRGVGVDNVSGVASVRLASSMSLDGQGRLNGAARPYAPVLQFDRSPTTDGVETVYAQFIDNAGNHATVLVSDSITVDTVPPTGTMTITRGSKASANGFTHEPNVQLQFSVGNEPDGGYVEVQRANDDVLGLQGAALQRVSLTMPWAITPTPGLRTVHFRLVDAAGNQAPAGSQSITLDTTPPTVTFALTNPGAQNALAVPLMVTGNDTNGLSTTAALALSDEPSFTGPSTQSFTTMPASPSFTLQPGEGTRSLHARVRDVAGNDAFAALSFVLDTRPPVASIELDGTLADGTVSQSLTSSTSVTVRLTPGDAVEYVAGTEALTTCPTTGYQPLPAQLQLTNHPLTASGEVRVCFRDAARNTTLARDTIAIDATGPAGCTLTLAGVTANGTPSGATKTARPGITVTATGCGDAVEMVLTEGTPTCTAVAPNAWSTFRGTSTFLLGGADGLATVRGCVRDAARNTSAVTAASITLDTTPPLGGTVSLNADAAWVNATQAPGGNTTFSVTGSATGAVRWAVGTTSNPTGFAAVAPVNLPATVSDGVFTVYAVFEDDVGNQTRSLISDTIGVDLTPPTVAGLSARVFASTTSGWTNTENVTVQITPSLPDATTAWAVERTGSGSCSLADFTGALPQPVSTPFGFVLSATEGTRRVCVRFRDAAGNDSIGGTPAGILEGVVTLDKTPPSSPRIVTENASVRLARGATQPVDIASASTDALGFRSYQQLGGLFADGGTITAWTDVAPSGPATRFTFRVDNDGSELGVRNELRLRATDLAGNASGESVVFITADTNAPPPLDMDQSWVDNGNGLAQAWFRRPANAGVTGYHVYYSSSPDFLDVQVASFAAQGPSPLLLPDQPNVSTLPDGGEAAVQSVTLSGLPNGVSTYVRVRAFDEAGNEDGDGGAAWIFPDGGTNRDPIQLQPDEVSANELARLALPAGATQVHRMAMNDSALYVLASSSFCTSNLDYTLHAIDLRGLAPPVQNGSLDTPRSLPIIASSLTLTGNTTGCDLSTANADLMLEGHWAYVTTPTRLFILNIAEPFAPTQYTSIDLTGASAGANFRAQSMCTYGERLGIAGRAGSVAGTFTTLWNLAELYDRNAATIPSSADRYTAATLSTATVQPDSIAFTREHVMAMGPSGSTNFIYRFDMTASLATTPGATVYSGITSGTTFPMASLTRPPVSGNYVYVGNALSGLSSLRVNSVWTGGDPTVTLGTSWKAKGPVDVAGHLAFMTDPERRAMRIVDVSTPSQARSVGVSAFESSAADGVITFGHHAVAASGPSLRFFELATPRALSAVASEPLAGNSVEVQGGFVFTGGRVFDLQASQVVSPTWPSTTGPVSATCFNGSTFGDGFEINGRGDGFSPRDLESSMDRTTTTSESGGGTVTLSGSRVTDVALTGNHLVVAEIRATGLFLEVFDIRKLRNRQGLTMSSADSIGSVQVAATAALPTAQAIDALGAKLALSNTRAAVALDFTGSSVAAGAVGPHLYFVELKTLLDDVAGQAPVIHGPVQIHQTRQVAIQGNTAYAATTAGLRIFDITPVMDSNAGTILSTTPTLTPAVDGNPFDGVYVSGSSLFAVPGYTAATTPNPAGVYAINVATRTNPRVSGFYPYSPVNRTCTPPGDVQVRRARGRITVAGNRAYFTTPPGTLEILKLE